MPKNRLLCIKRYLEEQTDEEHPAAVADILAYLADNGITAHGRTVASDIEQLIDAGLDVVCNKGRKKEYFIGGRHFETPELKLLLDAAQASKFLTAKRSRALIDKLLALESVHHAADLKSGLYLDQQVKPKNETAYLTADMLFTAIKTKRRITFMYTNTARKRKRYINITAACMNSARGHSCGITTAIISSATRKGTAKRPSFGWTG